MNEVWVIHDNSDTFKSQLAPPGQVHLRFFALLAKDRLSLRENKIHQIYTYSQVIDDQDTELHHPHTNMIVKVAVFGLTLRHLLEGRDYLGLKNSR